MLQIAFCDDAPGDISILLSYIKALKSASLIIHGIPYFSGPELLQAYKEGKRFDLVILDMVMRPMDGITLGKDIRRFDKTVPIIIVSESQAYALEGYKIQAYRYLLKPVKKEVFLACLKELFDFEGKDDEIYFVFQGEKGLEKINYKDIYYFTVGERNEVLLYSNTGMHIFMGGLKSVKEHLPEKYFFKQHRSYIVNLRHVNAICAREIILDNNVSLPLAHRKAAEARRKLLLLMKQGV